MKQYRKNQFKNSLKKLKGNYKLKGVDAHVVIILSKINFLGSFSDAEADIDDGDHSKKYSFIGDKMRVTSNKILMWNRVL